MARSFFASTIALVLSAAAIAYESTIATIQTAFSFAENLVRDAVAVFRVEPPFQPGPAPEAKQSLGLVAAKAFLLRLAQRDRPRHDRVWHMCPAN